MVILNFPVDLLREMMMMMMMNIGMEKKKKN